VYLYLFAAAAGVPLVLWFLLNGDDDGGDDAGAGDEGVGGLMFRLLPLSTLALGAATFGVCGLLLGAVGTGPVVTFVAAVLVAVVAGALNTTAFRYLRRSGSAAAVGDDQLAGSIGRVVLPVGGARRGRIAVSVGGQQIYLTARAVPDATSTELELEPGAPVLVVEVHDGVASVTRLDPELT
jgi:membrane protein implicated in regulation of membrane protease activity